MGDSGVAARYIGRVGALAVALGIGAAALTMPGLAVAETTDATQTEATTASESTTKQQDSAPEAGVDTPPSTAESTAEVTATVDPSEESAGETSTLTTSAAESLDGTVRASGGANTTINGADDTVARTERAVAASAKDSTPPATEDDAAGVTAAQVRMTVDDEPVTALVATQPEPAPTATTSVTASVALVGPSIKSAPLARPADPVTAFVTRVVSLAAGVMSLIAPPPAPTPVEAPLPWVLLAWVRRQFELTVFGHAPRVGFGTVTTSQWDTGAVTGRISALGADRDPIAIRVMDGPGNGVVTVDPDTGDFLYTPTEALARTGGIDRFTVAVGEVTRPNGLLDVIAAITGIRRDRATTATVLVPVLPGGAVGSGPDAADLIRMVADGTIRVHTDDRGAVRSIDGTFTDTVVRDRADAVGAINSIAGLLGAATHFADTADTTSQTLWQNAAGEPTEVVYRLQPTVNGVATVSSQVVLVTDGQGRVTGVFSSYDDRINDVDTTSRVDEESVAIAAAHAALVTSVAEDLDPAATTAMLAALTTRSDLVIYDADPAVAPRLARRVTVYTAVFSDEDVTQPIATVPAVGRTYYLYANGAGTGDVFAEISALHEGWFDWTTSTKTLPDLKGTSRTVIGQYQRISGMWRFRDTTRGLTTYSASSASSAPGSIVTKAWWNSWNRSAVSAHANTALVYDYYRDTLSHTSYDDLGSALRVSVLPNSYNNAFWDPNRKVIAFGRDYEAALDVVGHEYTHGVVNYAVARGGGLIYRDESGALNEAYADILGGLIENKTGSARWLIAEDHRCGSSSCAIRDMADPSRYGQPEHYANRYLGSADSGGVHTNSGIVNFAAYKMMTDPRTADVTDAQWAQVFYGSLFKLSTNATFKDGRAAVLNTAHALGFTTTQCQAMVDAFDAVGIAGL